MKSRYLQYLIAGGFALGTLADRAHAAFVTGQSADIVLGQSTFATKATATSQAGLKFPQSIAVDPTSGKVFVADSGNNRVLRYSSAQAMISGSDAEFVLGQADFVSSGAATTQSGMSFPYNMCIDSSGRLWLSDVNNQRILRFDNASTRSSKLADGVLGQASFTTSGTGTTASTVSNPEGVTVDSSGNLWVADDSNSRVLRFDHAATLANGAAAKVVLGQTTFTTGSIATSQSRMANPGGVFLDANGTLWVTDTGNNRVLRFNGAASLPDNTLGGSANGVIGQANYTTGSVNSPGAGFSQPTGALLDAAGNLYVADYFHERVIRYPAAATISTGGSPDLVFGQVSFSASDVPNPPTAASLSNAGTVTMDASGRIWIADTVNSRVLRYTPPVAPSAPVPTVRISGKKTLTVAASKHILKGTSSDSNGTLARIEVKVGKKPYKPAKGTASWKFTAHLLPGKNKILVRAVDASGVMSAPAKLTINRP